MIIEKRILPVILTSVLLLACSHQPVDKADQKAADNQTTTKISAQASKKTDKKKQSQAVSQGHATANGQAAYTHSLYQYQPVESSGISSPSSKFSSELEVVADSVKEETNVDPEENQMTEKQEAADLGETVEAAEIVEDQELTDRQIIEERLALPEGSLDQYSDQEIDQSRQAAEQLGGDPGVSYQILQGQGPSAQAVGEQIE
ncbi:hypothetical protein AWM75_03825 [Aerococcus urinaehominis]|uniref:Uncharacterized protein n=1 Tax=Aerococcus urinaehominis TaxID=128944 RepID=A0A0X8FM61_9LACT|nr:hypothetical protein [Aerococcus urinaehominis]AMB99187.1 hypothetical protein AWM75_03825 [Aerococcus urinaehominis]SDM06797.1 hypothetical protein SAMN04487985_104124 [Aerococcus urinaehominis]